MLKRKRVILLSTIVGISVLLTSGCSKQEPAIEYTLQQFERNELCSRRMSMYYGVNDGIGIGIEESIDSQENRKDIYKKITEDIIQIQTKFLKPSNDLINIYVIEAPLDNTPYIGDNTVYCTLQDLEDNIYRPALVRACYNLTEPAIIHGLTGYIWGEEVDESKLRDYYNETEDMSLLGLTGVRFYKEWNNEEQIQLAKDTATSLMAYLVDIDRKDMVLIQGLTRKIKEEWLQSIGVEKNYENPYEGELNQLKYSKSEEYPLIITSNAANYYIQASEEFLTSREIEKFLYKDIIGRKDILNYLKENAMENFKNINHEVKAEYYFLGDADKLGGLTLPGGRIQLYRPMAHLHEYVHCLTGETSSDKKWMQEGFAEYLSIVVVPDNYMVEIDFANIDPNMLSDDGEFWEIAFNYYKNKGGSFEEDAINRRLYVDAYAYVTLNTQGSWTKGYTPIGNMYDATSKELVQGNELSYLQACSFTAYLIDNYSLDNYLSYYLGTQRNASFEEYFGGAYEEIKTKWIEYISK